MTSPEHITSLLIDWEKGDMNAQEELFPIIYQELRKISVSYLRKERANHTLGVTGLVNEAYLRLVSQDRLTWRNRAHFYGVAAEMMRRILINYAKERKSQKRGGAQPILALEQAYGLAADRQLDLPDLDEALDQLAHFDQRKAKIVELKFFGGLTEEEMAEVLSISPATIRREWKSAKVWLYKSLNPSPKKKPQAKE